MLFFRRQVAPTSGELSPDGMQHNKVKQQRSKVRYQNTHWNSGVVMWVQSLKQASKQASNKQTSSKQNSLRSWHPPWKDPVRPESWTTDRLGRTKRPTWPFGSLTWCFSMDGSALCSLTTFSGRFVATVVSLQCCYCIANQPNRFACLLPEATTCRGENNWKKVNKGPRLF